MSILAEKLFSPENTCNEPRVPSSHGPDFEMSFWEITPAGGPLLELTTAQAGPLNEENKQNLGPRSDGTRRKSKSKAMPIFDDG